MEAYWVPFTSRFPDEGLTTVLITRVKITMITGIYYLLLRLQHETVLTQRIVKQKTHWILFFYHFKTRRTTTRYSSRKYFKNLQKRGQTLSKIIRKIKV